MADIQIIIGYETVTQADQAFKILDKTVNSTARQYEQAFNRITSWQKKFSNEQNKVNASLNTQHLAQQKSNKSARDSARAFEDAARAVEKEAAALRSLRMATDSVYRNQQKRLQMKKLLKSAIAAKTMTTEQAIVALKRYNAAQMSSTKVMGAARNKMNGNNMAIQQLGYQFGDFAVQVQGGTSAFVAFSQQGAQLAGILPMIASPLGLSMGAAVGLSAALGILIPIGSAVGRMFFEMRDSAKEAADEIASFEASLSSARSEVKSMVDDLKFLQSGFKNTFELTLSTSVDQAKVKLKEAQAALKEVSSAAALLGQGAAGGISLSTFGIGQSEEDKFNTAKEVVRLAIIELATAKELSRQEVQRGRNASVINQLHEVRQTLQRDAREEANKIAIKQQEKLDRAAADAYEQEGRRQSRNASVVTQLHSVRQSQQREAREEQTRINALEEQVSEYAKNNNWEKTQLQKTTQQILADAIQVYKQEKAIREEIGDAAAEALKLAGIDITTGVDAAAKAAAVLSANLGISLKHATELIALRGTGVSGPSATQYASQDEVVEGQGKRVDGLYGVVSQTSVGGGSKGGSSGGSSNVVNINEIIAAREKQMAQERVLLGLSGEQQEAQRIYYDLLKQNEKADVKLTNTELSGAADVIAAYEEQNRVIEENRKQQEDLADYIANSMGDALMGVVDGTMSVKDAFKSMAADIIKELYRVLVVQKLVAGVKTFLGYADGGVISGGTEVQAYANGGVVNGPTTFPMNGGKTGLMGEAGPEAIMPLKRGSNGKLGVQMEGGGGDTINVVQNFNFQANGDDTVKKLIAQAAPKIAQMTKSSLLDDRRRGGSTKAAFG